VQRDPIAFAVENDRPVAVRADRVRRLQDLAACGGDGGGGAAPPAPESNALDDVEGAPLEWSGGPVDVEVVADDVEGVFRVTADGRDALFTFAVPPLPMRPGPRFSATTDRNDHLCSELKARL